MLRVVAVPRGFEAMVSGHRLDDLQRLHGLLARVDRQERLRVAFAAHVKKRGVVGTDGYCSPRHRMAFNSRDEGSKRVC